MSWNVFTPTSQSRGASSTEPKVSIKNGKLSFNSKARTDHLDVKIGAKFKFNYATLMFNEKENKIGLVLKEREDETTFAITRTKTGNSAFLNALQFFKTYGKVTEATKKYAVTTETMTTKENNKDVKTEILVIDLNKPENVNYTPRKNSTERGPQTVQPTLL